MMHFHTLYPFSKTIFKQTSQPVSFYFWSWIGCGILLILCRIAICLAVQIGFTFLNLLPHLETAWYTVRLLFAVGGFFLLPLLRCRCIYHCAVAASLTTEPVPKRSACYRLSLCLHGLRLLAVLPLPFCLWSVRWCLQQGTGVQDGIWWLMAALQFITLAVLFVAGFFWLLPMLTAAPVLQTLEPNTPCRTILRRAFSLTDGRRKQWYRLLLQSLPLWLLPHCWVRLAMMQTIYIGVLCKELQYANGKGGTYSGTDSDMAYGAGTALHTGTVSQKRKKRIPQAADKAQTAKRALVQRQAPSQH